MTPWIKASELPPPPRAIVAGVCRRSKLGYKIYKVLPNGKLETHGSGCQRLPKNFEYIVIQDPPAVIDVKAEVAHANALAMSKLRVL